MNPEKEITVITARQLIIGDGSPPLKDQMIVIQGSKIIDIGPENSIDLPPNKEIKNLSFFGTVLPGLIDCHVHIASPADGTTRKVFYTYPDSLLFHIAYQNCQIALKAGVTTFRECGARNQVAFDLRKAVQYNFFDAPRLWLCGRPMTPRFGHMMYMNGVADGVAECQKTVRQLLVEGADFIKIAASGGGGTVGGAEVTRAAYSVQELKTIVEEAHRFGKKTAAHALATQSIVNCLDAGVDQLDHPAFQEPGGTEPGGRRVFREDVAKRIVETETWICPTLQTTAKEGLVLKEKKKRQGYLTEKEEDWIKFVDYKVNTKLENFKKMLDLGVKVCYGSDAGGGINSIGDTAFGLSLHVRGGMTPMQAIVAATGDAAKALDLFDVTGTITKGKDADIIVVDDDPIQDIMALESIRMTMRAGKIVYSKPYD